MKKLKTLLLIVLSFSLLLSCDEDDSMDDEKVSVDLSFDNRSLGACHSRTIAFVVTYGNASQNVVVESEDLESIGFETEQGNLIGVSAFDDNDSTNTLLASANIDTSFFSVTSDNNVTARYVECNGNPKIVWSMDD